ncbi:MAG: carbohydrate ABC transporter permease [Spirochaetia bacterium]|jgi:ABC-type glycerol-3-phosphate transport system permease component
MAIEASQSPGRLTAGGASVLLLLAVGALVCLLPFLFMASTSLKTTGETITRNSPIPLDPGFWPTAPQWGNYARAWTTARFSLYFRNSLIIALLTVAGVTASSSLAAYAFAKIRFVGSRLLFAAFLSTLMIPESVTLVPSFIVITRLGWYDTLAGLTVPFIASAFSIFLLRQFFAQLPNELLESARIDGAGHVRSFLSLALPLSRAPLFTVAFLAFVGSWNSLQWPLVVTRSERWRPITVGLTTFITEAGPQNELRMAGAVIAVLPVVLAYFLAQKQFTEAIARSGIKG